MPENDPIALAFQEPRRVRPTDAVDHAFDAEMVQSIHADIKRGRQKRRKWLRRAEKAFDYTFGDQVDKKGVGEGALFLSFNLIINRVLTKLGILTAGKPQAGITGRDVDNDDASAAFQDLLEYAIDKSDFSVLAQDAIQDTIICGLGVLEEKYDLDSERFTDTYGYIPGDVVLQKEDPRTYILDPNNADERLEGKRGPQWYAKEVHVARKQLQAEYPKKAAQIAGLTERRMEFWLENDERGRGSIDDTDDAGANRPGDDLTVYEYWYKRSEPRSVVLKTEYEDNAHEIPSRSEVAIDPETKEPIFEDEIPEVPEGANFDYEVIRRMVPRVWHAGIVGDVLLYNEPTPYRHGRWPAIFFCGMLRPDDPYPYGEVDRLVEPQDLFNTLVSVIVDNAIRTNNQGMLADPTKFAEHEQGSLVETLSSSGYVLEVMPDALIQGGAIQTVAPAPISQGLLQLAQFVQLMFDEIFSLAQVQKGGMPYDTSGRAIQNLVQAADTALNNLQTNVNHAITTWGRMRLRNIQQYMSIEESLRISDDYRAAFRLSLERHTPNGEMDDKLGLFKYEDENPERIPLLEDFGAAEFEVKFKIRSGQERDPREKREEAAFLHEKGLVTRGYLARMYEVPRDELASADEENHLLQTGKMVEELSQDKVVGPVLRAIIENPQTAQMIQAALARLNIPLDGAQRATAGSGMGQPPAQPM
uniref:Putative portal protein n=1 Tax=viral metagenome TaxID=1070528 RepID=A0A6M3LEU6_9ZZZZ